MAGVNSWVISYPADVVKTRIQAQHMDKPALYKGFFHGLECFKKERIQSISTNADEVHGVERTFSSIKQQMYKKNLYKNAEINLT